MPKKNITEPTLTCPNCKTEIKLTESLAAPILDAARAEFDKKLLAKDEEIKKREKKIEDAQKDIDEVLEQKLKGERKKIVKEESKRAKALMAEAY